MTPSEQNKEIWMCLLSFVHREPVMLLVRVQGFLANCTRFCHVFCNVFLEIADNNEEVLV
jgi:hypothetical protein